MSMNNLTVDGEFRYIIQWFNEWSELQRDDFIPIMVDYIADTNDASIDPQLISTATAASNMNGLTSNMEHSLNLNDKPMSLFQCRVKLFSQWNRRWPLEFKEKLQQKITEIDDKVGERIKESLNRRHNGCGSLTNGYAGTNGDDDDDEVHHYECNANTATKDHYPSQTSSNHQNESHVKEEAQQQQQPNEIIVGTNAVQLNDPMREVLGNETSVDDIEPNEHQQVNINRPGEGTDNVAHAFDSGINDDFNNTSHVPPEPVEQVVQMQNLQINEDGGHEEVTASIPGAPSAVQQQSSHTSTTPVTITVSAIAQSMTTNTEVPLVA